MVLDFGGTLYLDEEVTRTPFCKYGVVRKDAGDKAEASAPAEKKPAAKAKSSAASTAKAEDSPEAKPKSEAAADETN